MITHHPSEMLLAEFANSVLDEAAALVVGTHTHLYGPTGIDQALARCSVEHAPVIIGLVRLIGIGVRVEMYQRQLAVRGGVCPEQGQRDEERRAEPGGLEHAPMVRNVRSARGDDRVPRA